MTLLTPPSTTGSPILHPVQPGRAPGLEGAAPPAAGVTCFVAQGAQAQLSGSKDRLCRRCRVVRAAGAPGTTSPQLLVRLVLNEAAEHGEGSKRPVRGHHVAGSLRETGSSRSVPATGLTLPCVSSSRLPTAQPAPPHSDCSTGVWHSRLRHSQQPCPVSTEPLSPTLTVRKAMLVNSFTKPPIWFTPPSV